MADHRPQVAEKKRTAMRAKLLEATMQVFAEQSGTQPVIDDVISKAKVSRGTFYNYFDSIEQVLAAVGEELNNQMMADILPVYDTLKEPWQRISVGFRLFLVRAFLDRKWAGFLTRADAWSHDALVARYMAKDLERGKAEGKLHFDRVDAATDFLMGASAHGIQAMWRGVKDPNQYMDCSVRLAMASVGCDQALCDTGVTFSAKYLKSWAKGELTANRPIWARNINTEDGQIFFSHPLTLPH